MINESKLAIINKELHKLSRRSISRFIQCALFGCIELKQNNAESLASNNCSTSIVLHVTTYIKKKIFLFKSCLIKIVYFSTSGYPLKRCGFERVRLR